MGRLSRLNQIHPTLDCEITHHGITLAQAVSLPPYERLHDPLPPSLDQSVAGANFPCRRHRRGYFSARFYEHSGCASWGAGCFAERRQTSLHRDTLPAFARPYPLHRGSGRIEQRGVTLRGDGQGSVGRRRRRDSALLLGDTLCVDACRSRGYLHRIHRRQAQQYLCEGILLDTPRLLDWLAFNLAQYSVALA